MIINRMAGGGGSDNGFPLFEYTGTYTLLDDGNKNWRIKFLTSGTLVMEESISVDAFLVGGGSSGGRGSNACYYGGGGGGGYTKTEKGFVLQAGIGYSIVIGAGGAAGTSDASGGNAGGASSAFGLTANGAPSHQYGPGGNGGSGGAGGRDGVHLAGGTDGADGAVSAYACGIGQHTTTREFEEADGTLYAGGGCSVSPLIYLANSGNGGSGSYKGNHSEKGSSGIVIIRNHREAAA